MDQYTNFQIDTRQKGEGEEKVEKMQNIPITQVSDSIDQKINYPNNGQQLHPVK